MGMWKWGLEATASGALVRTPVPWGVEPAVGPACRWLGMAKPAPGGVAQRKRRRGPVAPIFRACSPCWQRSPPVGPSGCPWIIGVWTLLRLAFAMMAGSGSMSGSRNAAMTAKQKSFRIWTTPARKAMPRPGSGTTVSASPRGAHGVVVPLPFFGDYRTPFSIPSFTLI